MQAVVFRIGRLTCAAKLEFVREVLRPLPVEPDGYSVVRGSSVPVVDLSAFLGIEASSLGTARWVLLKAGTGALVIEASEVTGVRELADAELRAFVPVDEGSKRSDPELLGYLKEAILVGASDER